MPTCSTPTSGAYLNGADLSYANLIGAHLNGADLSYANLNGATLRGATLSDATLSDADLNGANLRGAKNLTQEQLDRACGNENTKLPEGLTLKARATSKGISDSGTAESQSRIPVLRPRARKGLMIRSLTHLRRWGKFQGPGA